MEADPKDTVVNDLMEWLNSEISQPELSRSMVSDNVLLLDNCCCLKNHWEAEVDESHNENRDWNVAKEDLASVAQGGHYCRAS